MLSDTQARSWPAKRKSVSTRPAPSRLRLIPAQSRDEELEKEKGGSGLRYSFDVKSGNATYEVGVDAVTGKVLENSKEGRHPD